METDADTIAGEGDCCWEFMASASLYFRMFPVFIAVTFFCGGSQEDAACDTLDKTTEGDARMFWFASFEMIALHLLRISTSPPLLALMSLELFRFEEFRPRSFV